VVKIMIGIVIGFLVCTYYPEIAPIAKYKFLESGGARDKLVTIIKEIE